MPELIAVLRDIAFHVRQQSAEDNYEGFTADDADFIRIAAERLSGAASTIAEKGAEIERLKNERVPKREQPCGCILCMCASSTQCLGCGSQSCWDDGCDAKKGIFEYERHPLIERAEKVEAELDEARAAFGRQNESRRALARILMDMGVYAEAMGKLTSGRLDAAEALLKDKTQEPASGKVTPKPESAQEARGDEITD